MSNTLLGSILYLLVTMQINDSYSKILNNIQSPDMINYRNAIHNDRFHSIGKKYLVELQSINISRKRVTINYLSNNFKELQGITTNTKY